METSHTVLSTRQVLESVQGPCSTLLYLTLTVTLMGKDYFSPFIIQEAGSQVV